MSKKFLKIGCVADKTKVAQENCDKLIKKYNCIKITEKNNNINDVDLIVVLGGDGFMLRTIHKFYAFNKPFYGLNVGNIGFLLNPIKEDNLIDRVNNAKASLIYPLTTRVTLIDGSVVEKIAFNEVYLTRVSTQAANLKIKINQQVRISNMVSDGVIVATAAGSSAYNASAGGPVIPIGAKIIALTAINASVPRKWSSALLPNDVMVSVENLNYSKRQVKVVADYSEVLNVVSADIFENKNIKVDLLFDNGHCLEERLIKEQFQF